MSDLDKHYPVCMVTQQELEAEQAKVKKLREALEYVSAIYDENEDIECRGDEDCDHCLFNSVVIEALEETK